MKVKIITIIFLVTFLLVNSFDAVAQPAAISNDEMYRPRIHFTPPANWMNDPNGMVYHKGVYHLFYQYHPHSAVWGPMHWGHASSRDLVHWKHEPIALYPDSLGTIFSGSAVVDKYNTTGFGKNGLLPLVAIFTHHDSTGEKTGKKDFQVQSLAYSIDEGKTWKKYRGNPVLKNPGITDFRDPKVIWYEPQKKWVMTLATKDRISFYSSPDLKNWKKESEFGSEAGAHGGVWECPDLFPLENNGKKIWVLLVSLNPGGPNKGSATQYFLGDFDGTVFTPTHTDTRWIDYGPDNYAGVTWSNTGNRKIFIGWMSNWLYANLVPTTAWRSAMTLPRELKLKQAGNTIFLSSEVVPEFAKMQAKPLVVQNLSVDKNVDLAAKTAKLSLPCRINLELEKLNDFSLILSNDLGEELRVGFDKGQNQYYIDRSRSGKIGFQKDFAARHYAPRLTTHTKMQVSLYIDASSIELFADEGLTVMTEIFFPNKPFSQFHLQTPGKTSFKKIAYVKLKSTWLN
ncbi:MAG TPA: glycoside hydrolase family 32 protein [Chitinophagaceae bacterium]|nr:glycoside hydrolase family 32 protein [Chitinophagaceae bacterium]